MIRFVGPVIGLGFAFVALIAFAVGAYTVFTEGWGEKPVEYQFTLPPKEVEFSHDGPFGQWDYAQLQRGYQVYKEVCAACHSIRLISFRNLAELGYSEAEVKAEAASWSVPGINPDTGEPTTQPGTPPDYFPRPYANDVAAAAANNNAVPPDLSLITKARHHGSEYVYSLLTGYRDPATFQVDGRTISQASPDFSTPPGLYFNPYFPNLNIAMSPPIIVDGQVTYADGTAPTIDQMSMDVAAFLTWTAEPTLIKRKQTGWPVIGFLLFATVLAWFAKKQIWAPSKSAGRRDGLDRKLAETVPSGSAQGGAQGEALTAPATDPDDVRRV